MALPEFADSAPPPQRSDDLATLERMRSNLAMQERIVFSVQNRLLDAVDRKATRQAVEALMEVLQGAMRAYREGLESLIEVEEALSE